MKTAKDLRRGVGCRILETVPQLLDLQSKIRGNARPGDVERDLVELSARASQRAGDAEIVVFGGMGACHLVFDGVVGNVEAEVLALGQEVVVAYAHAVLKVPLFALTLCVVLVGNCALFVSTIQTYEIPIKATQLN